MYNNYQNQQGQYERYSNPIQRYKILPQNRNVKNDGQYLNYQNPTSSILQRLQQLKKSMRPVQQQQSTQQHYQITHIKQNSNTKNNSNIRIDVKTTQNQSGIKNQRLSKYLPPGEQQQQQNHKNKNKEQYQSYRQSLQKKLNYLFDKEKQIFKNQLHNNNNVRRDKAYSYSNHNTDDLENKYQNLKNGQRKRQESQQQYGKPVVGKNKSYSLMDNSNLFPINHAYANSNKQSNPIVNNNVYRPAINQYDRVLPLSKKDQQFDQMQRKIKILEMKYLPTYHQNSSNQLDNNKNHLSHRNSNQARQNINKNQEDQCSSQNKKNRSKSNKEKNKKLNSKPNINRSHKDIRPHHNNSNYKQHNSNLNNNIDQPCSNCCNKKIVQTCSTCKCLSCNQPLKTSPNKQNRQTNIKYPLKDYIEKQQNNKKTSPKIVTQSTKHQQKLHEQFNQLKGQFNELLQLNRMIIQKVETSEEQKKAKKVKKQRAKQMLKQILFRLQQIKSQLKNQGQENMIIRGINNSSQPINQKQQAQEKYSKKSDHTQSKAHKQSSNISNKKRIQPKIQNASYRFSQHNQYRNKVIQQKYNIKTDNNNINKKTIINMNKKDVNNENISNNKVSINRQLNSQEVEKLRKLLQLEIKHRQIVQKKLQIIGDSHKSQIKV